MASVSTYLNFANQTEAAFNFYRSVFGTEFSGEITRFKDVPPSEDTPPLPEAELNLVKHVELPITGGHLLMGADAPKSIGFSVTTGNNFYISLSLDSHEETQRLFKSLSEGGKVQQELQYMFWGDYYGSCCDKFGIRWMFNYHKAN